MSRVFSWILWTVTTAVVALSIWMTFAWVREERTMGAVQKIFYVHLPAILSTYAAVFVLLGACLAYLKTRDLRWDNLARASTELGAAFCGLNLATGAIWARPAWNTWWTWEPRLTATLLLFLLLVGGLLLRGYTPERDLAARLTSVVGIVSALMLPVIIMAVRLWRGQHPDDPRMESDMAATLGVSSLAMLLLFATLLWVRYRTEQLHDRAVVLEDAWSRLPETES